ncbi:hypothetical protein N624_2829 [Levilactobacillus brevis]|nr:hypothetical protein N624_2829 [Levilactobacillus brevis]
MEKIQKSNGYLHKKMVLMNQKYYGAFIIRSGFSKELQQQNESLKAQIISQKLTTLQKKEKLPDSAKSKIASS